MVTKNRTRQIVLVISILMLSIFCSVFGSKQESPPESAQTESNQSPTPTLAPTNDVKIVDDGSPLSPQIVSMQPAGGQELAANGIITIQFDQPMDQNTTSGAFALTGPGGNAIPGEITWSDAATLQFDPKDPLLPGEVYRARLSASATSTSKIALADSANFDIVVASELQVSQVFPADETYGVESNAVITVIFNRPVVPLMTVEDQTSLPQPLTLSPQVAGHGEWLNTSVYVFHPSEALLSSTTYTARVEAGLTDVIGSQLDNPYEWQFTTVTPGIASFGLASPVSALNPENNYANVRLESSFVINFLQPMVQSSTESAFSLYSFSGENVPVDFLWETDYQMVITPTQRLALGTDYTLMLTPSAQAATGGTLEEGLRWNFSTLPYPGVSSTYPANGSTQDYYSNRFSIQFLSPMNLETIEERVVVRPKPEGGLTYYYNPWGWSADFYGLKPSTNYTVRLLPGAEDIYGNPISQEYNFSFRTADMNPGAYLDLPYGPAIYRMGGPMRFYYSYVNVQTVDIDLYQIPATTFANFTNGTLSQWDYAPPISDRVNSWHLENSKGINEITHTYRTLKKENGEDLGPGFYLITIDSPQVKKYNRYIDTRLLVLSDANLTFKTTQTEGLLWLTDLNSGVPISGVTLFVFDVNYTQIGQGTTNSQGLLELNLPAPANFWDGRYAIVNDGSHFAFAYSDWGSGVSPWDFGVWSDYYTTPDQPLAYVYTDRPLYRPGQPVDFKGIVRQNDDLKYSLLPWDSVDVEINSYDETVYHEVLPLSKFGTFDGEILLDENAALGYYSIVVRPHAGEDGIGGVGFSVAEYRKPEFLVTASADPEQVLAGNEFNVTVQADYFSGGGVANADVSWAMSAVDYTFQPSGDLSRYTFTDYDRDADFYNEFFNQPRTEIVASGMDKTDQNGSFRIALNADLSEASGSRKFVFEATVTDLAGTSVSDRTEVIAHQAEVYPGVRPQRYVGMVGEEQAFDLVVVDWDQKPVAGAKVDVEIVERRWYSVQKQDADGFVTWESTVEDIPVTNFKDVAMDAQGKGSVSFTPENGGVFKAKVTVKDEFGNQAEAGAYLWVSSSDFIPWRQTDDRRIDLVIDKDAYEPGDVAEILIASPFQGSNYALVTVERGHISQQEVLRLTSNSTVYRLPITPDMAPNVYVSVVVIQGADIGGKPDFRMGITELKVATDQQDIQIEITPDKEKTGPGEKVTYHIRTTDYTGQPVSAEVSVSLADLAALSLSSPNSTPILDFFYNQRSLSVQTAVPIVYSIEYYISTLEARLSQGEGMGSGGGKGDEDFGVYDVRSDFKDTAYWEAQIVTDESGEASFSVVLPDNLTTWRLDARAVTPETLVGDGENDIQSTKPLLVRPQTPRFFVAGDQSVLSAAIHNNTGEDLSVKVSLQAEGLSLKTAAEQTVEISTGSQAVVAWEVAVLPDVERVDLVFMAQGGSYSDASRPTLGTLDGQGIPVYKYEAPETVGTAGMLTESGSRTEGISIPSSWDVTQGDLTVKISPSLVAGMTEGLDYLEHYPYECIEQTISRFLPNVLTTQALKAAGMSDPTLEANLKEQVNIALQRLYNWQRADGGWAWWPTSPSSDPLTSAYVVLGLIEAGKAGYTVSADVRDQGLEYLKNNLMSLGSLDQQYLLNRQAFLLYVLARADEPQVSQTVQMYDIRQSLSIYARAFLAETLWRIDPEDSRLDTLISDFINAAVLSATGAHWQEDWRDFWNWNTDTRTTAIVLATMIKIDPENGLNPNAVRWLMSSRVQGHWATTQETAWTLMTLTDWMVETGELEANYDWAVGLNGERLGDGSANAVTLKETQELRVDVTQLFMDQVNRLTVARDEGSGNLYYTAHLNVYLPVDQIQPLDRGIIISREYFNPDVEEGSQAVTQANQGDLLLTRLTIVVPHDLHYVIIDDPLPAGLEAIDQSLETSPDITAPQRYDWQSLWKSGWGWWYFDHVELRDERVVLSADYLPAGTYVYTYLVRASIPGSYYTIPATAQEFYFPEVYGRGAGGKFVVKP